MISKATYLTRIPQRKIVHLRMLTLSFSTIYICMYVCVNAGMLECRESKYVLSLRPSRTGDLRCWLYRVLSSTVCSSNRRLLFLRLFSQRANAHIILYTLHIIHTTCIELAFSLCCGVFAQAQKWKWKWHFTHTHLNTFGTRMPTFLSYTTRICIACSCMYVFVHSIMIPYNLKH